MRQLVEEKTTPKNRDDQEIAGYRDVLNIIHESFDAIPLSQNYILQLHKIMYSHMNNPMAGRTKNTQNKIGKFTKQDIRELCPSLSISSIEGALRKMVAAGELMRSGVGKSTFYVRAKQGINLFMPCLLTPLSCLIRHKRRIDSIKILGIQIILHNPETLTESLEMHDFPLTKITDRIAYIMVMHQPKNVIIGGTGFLLRCHILGQIRNRISFGLEESRGKRYPACSLWPQAQGMVHIVFVKAGCCNFLRC